MSNHYLEQVEKDTEQRIADLEYQYNDLMTHYKKLQYKASRYETSNNFSGRVRMICWWISLFLLGVYIGVNYL